MTLVSPSTAAAADECAIGADPFVRLTEKYGEVRYVETATSNQIKQLHGRFARPVPGWEPIGLTVAELGLGISVSVRSELLSDGRFCSVLSKVDATVGYDVIDVYILRKYRRGSCQYSVVLNHEREHVVVFQSTLDEYIPRLRSVLEQTASAMRPIRSRDRNRAGKQMQREMQDAVRDVLDEISAVLDFRNARLDTDDAYRQQQRQCPTW